MICSNFEGHINSFKLSVASSSDDQKFRMLKSRLRQFNQLRLYPIGTIAAEGSDILVDGNWQNNRITPLFGNLGNQWLEQKLNLSAYINKKITVRFRITTGSSWQSDLAIDDFSIRDLSTGLNDEKMNAFGLYPNPNDGQFTIQFGDQRERTLQVFDIRGQLVENVIISAQRTDLDLSHLDKGLYIISIDGGLQQERLIIH